MLTVPDEWFRINNEGDVPSPALLIYPERVQNNIRGMLASVRSASMLRPHVKTHKLPQIVQMKLAAGITKFKASTIAECEMIAGAGGRDVLLAYQMVGPNGARFIELCIAYPDVKFTALVDHVSVLKELEAKVQATGLHLHLMMDVDVGMHRTGILPDDTAVRLYQEMCISPYVVAEGIHAYDGHLVLHGVADLQDEVNQAFEPVWKMRNRLRAEGHSVPVVAVAGSPTFTRFAGIDDIEVCCGTTVIWDFGQAATCPDHTFQIAASLLTRVVSVVSSNRICLDLGHKAVAAEMPLESPRVMFPECPDARLVRHSEEHLVIQSSAREWRPGDVLYALPRHICPTVALHQEVIVVHNRIADEAWPVLARNRRIVL